jgi:hypothetical protein
MIYAPLLVSSAEQLLPFPFPLPQSSGEEGDVCCRLNQVSWGDRDTNGEAWLSSSSRLSGMKGKRAHHIIFSVEGAICCFPKNFDGWLGARES